MKLKIWRKMKVLISDNLAPLGEKLLREAGLEVDVNTGLPPEELKAIIPDYDGLVIRSATKVRQDIIEAATKLKVVGRAGIGLDNVDIPAASEKGIVVMNAPDGNATTAAEHAISMMMSLARNIPQATASMKAGKWEKKSFMGREVTGKTLGIVGIGRIGSIVANRAQGLQMKVVAYDPFMPEELVKKLGVERLDLLELARRADFISVHTPLTKDTHHLLSTEFFANMKEEGMFIDCARGGVLDEDALYEALLNTIYTCKKRIWIVTPYFVPDENIVQALIIAHHKGIDVKLITPKHSDHLIADLGRSPYMRELDAIGVDVILYEGEMLHAKAILFDDVGGMIGSVNIDNRSLFLNYEIVTFAYSPHFIESIESWMQALMENSTRGMHKPTKLREAVENMMKVFAPLL